MRSITVYYNKQKIILWEKTPELEIKIDALEVEEPFLHKCNDRMSNILNTFFDREIEEISFEHYDFEKLLNDFKSHFTFLEAAGGIVKNKKGELLVIRRFGIPDLPKGKIEQGESPEIAAVREVEEECGIKVPEILEKTDSSYHIYIHKNKKVLKKTHWYLMTYQGEDKPIPQVEEEITKVEWCDTSMAKKYRDETYDSLKHYFQL